MAPINLNVKQSANSTTTTTTTIASSAQDILVRETLRISANLASSSPLLETTPVHPTTAAQESTLRFICCEEIDGRRWKYVAETDPSASATAAAGFKKNSFRALSLQTPQAPLDVASLSLFPSSAPLPFPYTSQLIPAMFLDAGINVIR